MNETITFILNSALGLFVIVDPFAVLPVYLFMTDRYSDVERLTTRRKATLIALLVLLAFAAFGMKIFSVFGITLEAFQIAGGILLLLIGIAQLNSKRDRIRENERQEVLQKDDVSVFPLGVPLLAGPGAISTVVLYSSQADTAFKYIGLLAAVIIVMLACHLVLRSAPILYRLLGQTGLNVFTRLMGILLTAVAVQFIVDGLTKVLAKLSLG